MMKRFLFCLLFLPVGLYAQDAVRDDVMQMHIQNLTQNPYILIAGGGLCLSFMLYFFFWMVWGRDPDSGVIVPRFTAPVGVSPASARCLMRMGFDSDCLAVAILSLAAKGWLRINQPTKFDYELWKEAAKDTPLSHEEQGVFRELLGTRERFEVKRANYKKMQKARGHVKDELMASYSGSHFNSHGKCLLPGIIVLFLTLGAFAWISQNPEVSYLMLWLSFWTIAVMFLLKTVFTAWRGVFGSFNLGKFIGALFITAFAIPFVGSEILVGSIFASYTSVTGTLLLVLQFPLVLLFAKLMKSPTFEGRKLMDELEGLKMYLSTVEGDRMHIMHPPKMTAEHFDELLPYAVALGVEQKWSEAFAASLQMMNHPQASNYHPHFYSGLGFASISEMTSALGRDLLSQVNSASSSPNKTRGRRRSSIRGGRR